ncbi:YARHG domain-containing protein [Bacillus sp. sid0103]|nr:YARHG domain-containing protein [Bacillus sp. sid0103]
MIMESPVFEEAPLTKEGETRSVHKNHHKGFKLAFFSLLGIVIVGLAAFFIINNLLDTTHKVTPVNTTKKENTPKAASKNKEDTDKTETTEAGIEEDAQSKQEEVVVNSEESIIRFYTNKLNNLRIFTSGRELSVGEWSVTHQDGSVLLSASAIPSRDLARIFGLFDEGNLLPLKTWAKEVYQIADTLSKELHADWVIGVGNNCVGEYPVTLPQSDILNFSGSCGYSIPVLEGSSKDNLTLVMHTNVFGTSTSKPPRDSSSEYIFPDSDFVRLTMSELVPLTPRQLRLARNEIYARHGYIFESDDLRIYFSNTSWYFPDPSYDGTTLNAVEKYNVKLIQDREKDFK